MAKRRHVKKTVTRRKSASKTRGSKRKPAKRAEMAPRSFDRGMEEFGEEAGKLGERFGRHMERKGKEWESSWNRTLGVTGPFFSSIFALICLAVVLWIFNLVNLPLGSMFLTNVYGFVISNLALFFAFFLFFSYTSYFSKKFSRAYMPISPIVVAIGVTIGFWILMSVINLINISFVNAYLTSIALFIQYNLFGIFILFLVLGYVVLFIKAMLGKLEMPEVSEYRERMEDRMVRKKPRTQGVAGVKRLYRSGRDKILGGVCGGIAEYLGVDPVLIRLIWVIAALGWGTGILAYIIAWIIIPRNPRDKWD
jgi:phage shock protein C